MFNKQTIKKHLVNFRGPRLQQKYLVFESDDWGAIRIPNVEVREFLWEKGLTKKTDPFSKFDSLETTEDYQALFDVLLKFKDQKGNHPLITANFILNNPNFDAIKKDNFQNYKSELFLDSYSKHPGTEKAGKTLEQGISQNLMQPQFHGSEHLNVMRWMQFLREKQERYCAAFDLKCYAIEDLNSENRRSNLMAAYDYNSKEELDYIQDSIKKGLQQFKDIFGFASQTTIAPCYVWNDSIEQLFHEQKVDGLQGSFLQNIPKLNQPFQKKYHYSGQKNKLKQTYLVRNGLFEPSLEPKIDWVNKCLESIEIAFQWGKPAIIGTHRINFAGRLDAQQRNQNLKDLELLIKKIVQKWPEIEFLDSAALYQKIKVV
jgi:hypothetical protein